MSYNIDSVECVHFERVRMKATKLRKLAKAVGDCLPESCFLKEHEDDVADADGFIVLTGFQWCYTWSGNSLEFLIENVAPHVMGEVDAIFTWEGGDSHSGLRIRDGVVEECEVAMALVRPPAPAPTKAKRAKRKGAKK